MNRAWIFISICIVSAAVAFPAQEAKQTAEEKPDQEFVFVQSSGSKAKPITRKDKTVDKERPFETAHKFPPSLTYALNDEEEETTSLVKLIKKSGKKVHKRAAQNAPAPAPAGAIKLNVAKLLEKYKQEIKTSTTEKPSSTAKTTKPSASRRRIANKRTKKEIKAEDSGISATSPSPVLTTSKIAPKNIDMDVVGAASEKQRSRIQIKKGPNGQEYEYEYVYYYYDEDDDKEKITNAHDGPAKNTISRSDKNREKPTPEANEVVPSRGKARGRQLGEDEPVQEERLPANTRFPPRSRNLNTTPVPEDEDDSKVAASRTRPRGKATTESSNAEDDNVSDETQGTRGRTRANVRRPSLVDSETFNTHSAAATTAAQSPSFPAQLPAGPEDPEDKEPSREPAPVSENTEETKKPLPENGEPTTPMAGMEKVALDLYAISQGTQKLFGEDGTEISTEDGRGTGETDATTQESSSTEEIETTTPTTTTTTTTTTPAPTTTTRTTTTTTEAPTKAGRFGGRRTPLSGRKGSSTTTTEASSPSEKPKKFGRPSSSFGGRRNKPTHAPVVEEDSHKEESKPVSQSKPATRGRFGGPRTRGRTTSAPEERKDDSSTSAPTTNHKPPLPRSRPSFNSLKGRGRTTTSAPASEEAPADSEPQGSSSEPVSTTTARARRILPGATGNIKPLRPGPRINLAGRRGGQTTTTTTTEASAAENNSEADSEEETHVEAASEKDEAPAPAPVDNSPLGRLRNKQNRVNIQPKSKSTPAASASAQVQVRRVNPLLARRRPGVTTEAPSSEAPSSEAPEEAEEAELETEAAPSSSTTTEEPKGLSKLLAGRRRAGARVPGTINHK